MSLWRDFSDGAARWQAAAYLLGWFCVHLVISGLTTAWLIIRPAVRPQAGLMRVTYDGLSEVGAAIFGCLVTLTPGTTVIDVDPEKQTILLHVLNIAGAERLLIRVRSHFEAPLRRIFPLEKQHD